MTRDSGVSSAHAAGILTAYKRGVLVQTAGVNLIHPVIFRIERFYFADRLGRATCVTGVLDAAQSLRYRFMRL